MMETRRRIAPSRIRVGCAVATLLASGCARLVTLDPAIVSKRNDETFSYVAAWEFTGETNAPKLNKEPLTFEYVHPSQRSYK